MISTSNTCVLVLSCDKYCDLWDPFFHFFEKYWPGCPFPVFLATNHQSYSRPNIQQVFSGINSTWSEETLSVLRQLPYQHIIYLQDDYFILKPVNNSALYRLIDKAIRYDADYVRLYPAPGADASYNDDELGLITPHAPYRTSLQSALWKKETWIALLDEKENQWQFEVNGGLRSANFLFLSLKPQQGSFKHHTYPISYYYLTAVLRGKWRYEAAAICKKEGLTLNANDRPVESYGAMLYQKFYQGAPLLIKKISDYVIHKLLTRKKQGV